uniref:ATP-dependent DNA helicase n=1 Tax=Caenorhabditis japonica TaxID=281687 RepID=A0A8R1IZK7_CAEJA
MCTTDDFVDLDFHTTKRDQIYATLNPCQKEFCDTFIAAATDFTLLQIPLLPNGQTSASLFKLNIGNDSKTSNHSKGSKEAKKLKEVDVLIWNECFIVSKTALETADFVLQNLTESPFPFGRKLIVLGGDFRPILPVLRRGTKTDLMNNCIKNSYHWNQFQKFSQEAHSKMDGTEMLRPLFALRPSGAVCNRTTSKPKESGAKVFEGAIPLATLISPPLDPLDY